MVLTYNLLKCPFSTPVFFIMALLLFVIRRLLLQVGLGSFNKDAQQVTQKIPSSEFFWKCPLTFLLYQMSWNSVCFLGWIFKKKSLPIVSTVVIILSKSTVYKIQYRARVQVWPALSGGSSCRFKGRIIGFYQEWSFYFYLFIYRAGIRQVN